MIAKDGVSRARVADGADGADGMAAHTRRLMGWGNGRADFVIVCQCFVATLV